MLHESEELVNPTLWTVAMMLGYVAVQSDKDGFE